MHKIYKGRFYNGISSKEFTVALDLGEELLKISYSEKDGTTKNIVWQKNLIRQVQLTSGIISLKYGSEIPFQQLDVTDKEFIREYKNHFYVSHFERIAYSNSRHAVWISIVAFFALTLLAWFFLLPFVADIFAQTFPKDMEISLGQKIYENVLKGEEIDSAKTSNINLFFSQMKVGDEYPVQITVVNKEVANAFALPGGGIVVYDKILVDMKNYDELAALLAHEYSHVILKHSTRNIFRNLSGYLFITMLFGDVSGVTAIILQNLQGLETLKYSRKLEHEADENGLKILKDNKTNPEGMKNLFLELKKESEKEMGKSASSVPEMFSSHPDMDSRIDFVNEFEKENRYTPIINDSMKYYFEKLK